MDELIVTRFDTTLTRFCFSAFMVWVATLLLSGVTQTARALNTPRTGLVVPLYIYPGADWDRLIQAKNNNSRVPMIAVINPNSGPGESQDANYLIGVQNLKAAGITVLGYVHTAYASRPVADVEAEINTYKNWYPLDGIFLDQMSDVAGNETYYSDLNAYIKSLGFTFTMGNPATDTLPSYVGTVDNMIIYENAGLPSLASLDGWHGGYPKQNFSMIAYGVSGLDPSFINSASDYVGYLYVTDDVAPNPWDTLPPYFEQLVSILNNKSPIANNAFTVKANATLNIPAPGILSHDFDPDDDSMSAVLVNGPANGALTLNTDGSFTYTPVSSFTGIDIFTYLVRDSFGAQSNPSTVTIEVTAP
ncbi:MAG TPA: spherulation-specific family 4 protein [Anaerolineales bacterium]|nr:spherulation-specific family 4 protein [Anaerolineales bacterium]